MLLAIAAGVAVPGAVNTAHERHVMPALAQLPHASPSRLDEDDEEDRLNPVLAILLIYGILVGWKLGIQATLLHALRHCGQ
jgi:hypothetical protein